MAQAMVTYQAIAAEIRERIESGRLRPGAHVPSTRAITREWGAAVATATKALRALQAEGLVRGVVGVGTVVVGRLPGTGAPAERPAVGPQGTAPAGRRRAGRDAETELSRDRVVRTAVAIADGEGLPAVTMRRLAVELDVAVMSLYRHVPSKDDLVVLMVDHAIGEADLPDPLPAGWRERVEAMARLQWRTLKQHAWMGSVMSLSRPLMAPKGMSQTDFNVGVFREMGFDPTTALQIELALAGLLFGVGASLQLEVETERDTGLSATQWWDQQEEALSGLDIERRFPHLAAVEAPPELEEVFELGLALLLDGLAQRLTAAASR